MSFIMMSLERSDEVICRDLFIAIATSPDRIGTRNDREQTSQGEALLEQGLAL